VSERLSKEELKEDRVAVVAMQAMDYARRNARWVVAAVGLMVVAVAVAIVVVQSRTTAEREASLALMRAQAATSNGNYTEALPQLEALAGRWGSTPAGREGRLFLGAGQLAAGNAAAAEQAYRKFLASRPGDNLAESTARRGLAGSLTDQGKYADGANEYQKTAAISGNPLAAEDWLQAGLAFLKAGQRDAAVQAFQEIVSKYPRSSVVAEARVRLREALASAGS
jgi:tetratricopeptide (TPR) repeat protein